MTFLALYVFLTLWAPLYLAVLQSRSCWLMDHRSAVSVLHHHLSVSVCVCESVCSHVCVPAHSCWQCSSHIDWSVCKLCPAYLLRLKRRVWRDRVPAYLSVLLALLSSPLGSLSWGWSHIDTQHICFCSFLHLKRMTVLWCKKNKKILHQNFIVILMWLRKINVYYILYAHYLWKVWNNYYFYLINVFKISP